MKFVSKLSFYNKKELINGIDWFIPCTMNANEISPKINPRLNRIKIVSRIARYICFVFLTYSVWFYLWLASSSLTTPEGNATDITLMIMVQMVVWVWYWKLTRLFHFYERGLIFAAETIRCIKTLGLLCVIGWTFATILHLLRLHPLSKAPKTPVPPSTFPSGVVPHITTLNHTYRMGFFTFDFGTGIDFGWLLTGAIIVLVAWVMDEGRKIQEEQELTV